MRASSRLNRRGIIGWLLVSSLLPSAPLFAECEKITGQIEVDGTCVCPSNTMRIPEDVRCLPICPPSRQINCRRHDIIRTTDPNALPIDYCDCLPDGPHWDTGLPPKLTHCAPFTGEVLRNGDCVCPEGQRYHRINGFWRCRPPCEPPKEWDCSRQLTSVAFGRDLSGSPDQFCDCVQPPAK